MGHPEQEFVYAPHVDFFVEMVSRKNGYEMANFHTHHKYEIYYEVEGSRRYFIEDAAYIVNAGSVVLIGENQIHKTGALGDGPSTRIVVNFSAEYLQGLAETFPEVDFFTFLGKEENHLLSNITVKQQNKVYSLLMELLQLQDDRTPEAEAARRLLLGSLLLLLQKLCARQQELGGDNGRVCNRVVDQVRSYIAVHYPEKLRLDDIAGAFYISPYYLSRLFKRVTNLSMVEYINGVRIKAAQNLIEHTDEGISAIAEKSGYTTTAHFRRVFKEATGFSPQEYRRNYRRQNKSPE